MKTRLYTPGPVEIPARILRALSQVPPHHRTDVFRQTILKRVTEELKRLHGTEGEVFLLAASGTGAMEAAVVNSAGSGDKALVVTAGKFGDRWASILKAYGIAHETLAFDWGTAIDPAAIERALDRDPQLGTVFITHSETSTGAIHDVEAIAQLTRAKGRRIFVDAITSVGVHPMPQDAWGVDVVVCGSQKGLMCPPGIATIATRAVGSASGSRATGCRASTTTCSEGAEERSRIGETSFTPPVSLVLALEEALTMIREERAQRSPPPPPPPRAGDARRRASSSASACSRRACRTRSPRSRRPTASTRARSSSGCARPTA